MGQFLDMHGHLHASRTDTVIKRWGSTLYALHLHIIPHSTCTQMPQSTFHSWKFLGWLWLVWLESTKFWSAGKISLSDTFCTGIWPWSSQGLLGISGQRHAPKAFEYIHSHMILHWSNMSHVVGWGIYRKIDTCTTSRNFSGVKNSWDMMSLSWHLHHLFVICSCIPAACLRDAYSSKFRTYTLINLISFHCATQWLSKTRSIAARQSPQKESFKSAQTNYSE